MLLHPPIKQPESEMSQNNYKTQSEKYEFISGQHGGCYRHDFTDHAYLYNLYFPPEVIFTNFKDQIHGHYVVSWSIPLK